MLMEYGNHSVTILGIIMMHMQSVDNLDIKV